MSEQKISKTDTPANTPETPAMDAPLESQSVKSLWEEHGRPLVVGVLLVAAVFWGISAWRNSKAQQKADESAALLDAIRADSAETLQTPHHGRRQLRKPEDADRFRPDIIRDFSPHDPVVCSGKMVPLPIVGRHTAPERTLPYS